MGTYRNYMRLLEAWPLDNSKPGKDLAQHIRDQLKLAFSKGENSEVDREQCDRYYASLTRLCSNHYGRSYPRVLSSTASGLTREQCNLMLTPDALDYFRERQQGFFTRTFSRLFRNVVDDKKAKE